MKQKLLHEVSPSDIYNIYIEHTHIYIYGNIVCTFPHPTVHGWYSKASKRFKFL